MEIPLKNCYYTLEDGAVAPTKAHATDSGYDLSVIKLLKVENGVHYYSTGVRVQPPDGYYFELVPRSSIAKLGYTLSNSIGVIDSSYRGDIIVALRKVNDQVADLELPCRCCQLIPRERIDFDMMQVQELTDTVRGSGGFGSTGK